VTLKIKIFRSKEVLDEFFKDTENSVTNPPDNIVDISFQDQAGSTIEFAQSVSVCLPIPLDNTNRDKLAFLVIENLGRGDENRFHVKNENGAVTLNETTTPPVACMETMAMHHRI
jgi:hypothetical protein